MPFYEIEIFHILRNPRKETHAQMSSLQEISHLVFLTKESKLGKSFLPFKNIRIRDMTFLI